jgi:hypothetical protein
MRYFILIPFLLLAALPLRAEEQTLVRGKITHGGYGAPVIKITSIEGSSAVLVGGQGAWLIGHTFGLGLAGYGMATQREYDQPGQHNAPEYDPYDHRRMELGYGGILLSYIHQSDRLVHGTVDLLIGGGTVSMSKRYRYYDEWDDRNYDHSDNVDGFFVLEPAVSAEVNLLRFMRFDAGIGYRWVSGVSRFGYSNSDVSGVTGTLALKFGKF